MYVCYMQIEAAHGAGWWVVVSVRPPRPPAKPPGAAAGGIQQLLSTTRRFPITTAVPLRARQTVNYCMLNRRADAQGGGGGGLASDPVLKYTERNVRKVSCRPFGCGNPMSREGAPQSVLLRFSKRYPPRLNVTVCFTATAVVFWFYFPAGCVCGRESRQGAPRPGGRAVR